MRPTGIFFDPAVSTRRVKVVVVDERDIATVEPIGQAVAKCGEGSFTAWLAELNPDTQKCVLASAGRETRRRL